MKRDIWIKHWELANESVAYAPPLPRSAERYVRRATLGILPGAGYTHFYFLAGSFERGGEQADVRTAYAAALLLDPKLDDVRLSLAALSE